MNGRTEGSSVCILANHFALAKREVCFVWVIRQAKPPNKEEIYTSTAVRRAEGGSSMVNDIWVIQEGIEGNIQGR